MTSPTEKPKTKMNNNFFQSKQEDYPNPLKVWTALLLNWLANYGSVVPKLLTILT